MPDCFPVALSPCPNDTFLFHAWIEGLVGQECKPEPTFADIEQLNAWALAKKFPLIKTSFATFRKIQKDYQLLPVGAALGWNVGPKLIATHPFTLEQIPHLTIAYPGEETTAHFLCEHLLPKPQKKLFCLYHEIATVVQQAKAHLGVIIHESRFTFQKAGFYEIADLGKLWHEKYHLPLPLGGLALHRDLDPTPFTRILQESLLYARHNPEASRAFVETHAQEKERSVIEAHISLYVNEETYALSPLGKSAIAQFLAL